MSSGKRVFTLGYIGGCLPTQPGLDPQQRLPHRLRRAIDAEFGFDLRFQTVQRVFATYADRLESLCETTALDAVVLHVRTTFLRKVPLFATLEREGRKRRTLHPFLLRRHTHGWHTLEKHRADEIQVNPEKFVRPLPGLRIGGVRVRDANYMAGWALGLHRWAMRDEQLMLGEFLSSCAARRLPCVVMGPLPCPGSLLRTRLCRTLDQRLAKSLGQAGIPYCSVMALDAPHEPAWMYADGLHPTADGHGFVADLLMARLRPLLQTDHCA